MNPPSDDFVRARDAMYSTAAQILKARKASIRLPPKLFHFTDAAGLIGIFKNRKLWASLATALNDPSEIRYGVTHAAALIERRSLQTRELSIDRVVLGLDPDHPPTTTKSDWRSYVTSFCAHTESVLHWLHYSQSGTGAAIAFDAAKIEQPPFDLYPVVYDQAEQDELVTAILASVDQFLLEHLPHLEVQLEQERLREIAADLAANYILMAASRMKNPAFAAGMEWRLIAYEPRITAASGTSPASLPTLFRQVAGRIVPYKEVAFDPLPALEIILGFAMPIQHDDEGLTVLMEETLGRALPVSRSHVPVRA